MDESKRQIRIELIKEVDATFINQLNVLLDEGTEWDSQEGTKFLKDSNNACWHLATLSASFSASPSPAKNNAI